MTTASDPLSNPGIITRIADWLRPFQELYVDLHLPHSAGGGTGYFVGSADDIVGLINA